MSNPKEILSQSLLQKLESDLFSYVTSMIEENDNVISDDIKEIMNGLLVSSDIVNEDEAANFCADLISKLSIHNGTASSAPAAPAAPAVSLPKPPAVVSSLRAPVLPSSTSASKLSTMPAASIPFPPSTSKAITNNQKAAATISLATTAAATTNSVNVTSESSNKNATETPSTTSTTSSSSLPPTTTTTVTAAAATTKEKKERKPKVNKKATPAELAEQRSFEIEQELYQARVLAAKERSTQGAYNGALEATHFTLPNPGTMYAR